MDDRSCKSLTILVFYLSIKTRYLAGLCDSITVPQSRYSEPVFHWTLCPKSTPQRTASGSLFRSSRSLSPSTHPVSYILECLHYGVIPTPHIRLQVVSMSSDDAQFFIDWIETFFVDAAIIWCGAAIYYISLVACIRYLIKYTPNHHITRKRRNILLIFLCCSFVATTIFTVSSYGDDAQILRCLAVSRFIPEDCIKDGGPINREDRIFRKMYVTSEIIIYFGADGMLLYRAIVIWQWRLWLTVLGPLFLLAQTGIQIYRFLPFTTYSDVYGRISWTLAATYDVLMSCLIIGRLCHLRRKAESAGSQGNIYKSLMFMFLEACVLTSTTRIVNLATDWNADWWNLDWWDEDLSGIGSAIAPLLAIIRLALQQCSPEPEVNMLSSMRFAARKRSDTDTSDSTV